MWMTGSCVLVCTVSGCSVQCCVCVPPNQPQHCWLGNGVEHGILRHIHWQQAIKLVLVLCLCVVHIARLVPQRNLKLDLVVLMLQCPVARWLAVVGTAAHKAWQCELA